MRYFSNESLEDRNSTTSSTEEGSINVERRKVMMMAATTSGVAGEQGTAAVSEMMERFQRV